MAFSRSKERWLRVPIHQIEDLSDAVYGAGLEATQMNAGGVTGSLAFAQNDGIIYCSGSIFGTVALTGPLSLNKVTLGVGLKFAPGSWHWMREVSSGVVGVFHAGEEHDCHYTPGALYATLSLDMERLEGEAASENLVLDRRTLGGTGLDPQPLDERVFAILRQQFERIHNARRPLDVPYTDVGSIMLDAFVNHFGRAPHNRNRGQTSHIHAAIIRKARSYILEHLAEPISLNEIAAAAYTSRRTVYRAFTEILNETPQGYIRRLRLHRIRRSLASDVERSCTITLVANHWGISELGRMSGWYRELFGELPSDTHAHAAMADQARVELSPLSLAANA